MFFFLIGPVSAVIHTVAKLVTINTATVVTPETVRRLTWNIEAQVKFLIRAIDTVIFSVADPKGLDTHVVFTLKHGSWAVGAVGKASRAAGFIGRVQTICSPITRQCTGHTVSTCTLKMFGVAGLHLTIPFI